MSTIIELSEKKISRIRGRMRLKGETYNDVIICFIVCIIAICTGIEKRGGGIFLRIYYHFRHIVQKCVIVLTTDGGTDTLYQLKEYYFID